ncbi:MAG: hypothetical protein ACI8TX_001460, partial [Hyphomicrobiaceae bacterium]
QWTSSVEGGGKLEQESATKSDNDRPPQRGH